MSEDLKCPHPDCDEQVLLDWHLAYAMDDGDVPVTQLEHGIPITSADAHAVTWMVGCLGGHVLLTPGYLGCCEADDCEHNPDEYDWSEDNRTFRPHDRRRLGEVISALSTIPSADGGESDQEGSDDT